MRNSSLTCTVSSILSEMCIFVMKMLFVALPLLLDFEFTFQLGSDSWDWDLCICDWLLDGVSQWLFGSGTFFWLGIRIDCENWFHYCEKIDLFIQIKPLSIKNCSIVHGLPQTWNEKKWWRKFINWIYSDIEAFVIVYCIHSCDGLRKNVFLLEYTGKKPNKKSTNFNLWKDWVAHHKYDCKTSKRYPTMISLCQNLFWLANKLKTKQILHAHIQTPHAEEMWTLRSVFYNYNSFYWKTDVPELLSGIVALLIFLNVIFPTFNVKINNFCR